MVVNWSELQELVMDKEAWRAAIHGVTKSRTWLSNWTELNPILYILFILILAVLGLSYSVQDPLLCLKDFIALRHVGSQFPDQESNPCLPHWKMDS